MLRRLFLPAMLVTAGPGLAADDAKAANCAASAAIVSEAVAHRLADQTADSAIDYLRSDEADIDDSYDDAIPLLVEWVYSLEPAQVTDDTAPAFDQQCLAYDG